RHENTRDAKRPGISPFVLHQRNQRDSEEAAEIDAPIKNAVDARQQMLAPTGELIADKRGHTRLDAASPCRNEQQPGEKNRPARFERPRKIARREQGMANAVSE